MSSEVKFNIDEIAALARLSLKPEEKAKLSKDLASILDYVNQLQELKIEQVEPTSHVLSLQNVFRPDEPKVANVSEDVLQHAPKREGSFFKVPKVIGE